jgi:tetratricopeptide (TPR) repeat protein
LGLKLRLDPGRKAALLDEAAGAFRSGPVDQLNQFAAWLNQRHEFGRTLAVLPYEQALKRRDSFIIHLDALAGLDHWAEVGQILGREGLPLQDSILEAFRARAALKLQQVDQAAFHWRRAVQAARDDVEQLEFVAQYAEKNTQYSDAIRAYRAVLQAEPSRMSAYLSLSRILQQHGSTTDLLDLMGQMARVWPQNPTFKNDLAYLNLLLNKDVASSRKTAEELVRQFPQLLPIRCTLALACLRAKEPALALGLLSDGNVDWRQALPGDRAVYIGALVANGRLKEAQALASDLPTATLRKEELDLVRAACPKS